MKLLPFLGKQDKSVEEAETEESQAEAQSKDNEPGLRESLGLSFKKLGIIFVFGVFLVLVYVSLVHISKIESSVKFVVSSFNGNEEAFDVNWNAKDAEGLCTKLGCPKYTYGDAFSQKHNLSCIYESLSPYFTGDQEALIFYMDKPAVYPFQCSSSTAQVIFQIGPDNPEEKVSVMTRLVYVLWEEAHAQGYNSQIANIPYRLLHQYYPNEYEEAVRFSEEKLSPSLFHKSPASKRTLLLTLQGQLIKGVGFVLFFFFLIYIDGKYWEGRIDRILRKITRVYFSIPCVIVDLFLKVVKEPTDNDKWFLKYVSYIIWVPTTVIMVALMIDKYF